MLPILPIPFPANHITIIGSARIHVNCANNYSVKRRLPIQPGKSG